MQSHGHARVNGYRPLVAGHISKDLFILNKLAKKSQIHANVMASQLKDVLDRLQVFEG